VIAGCVAVAAAVVATTSATAALAAAPRIEVVVGAVDVVAPLTQKTQLEVPVTLSAPDVATNTLHYAVVAGTAQAGKDVVVKSGVVVVAKGAVEAAVPVTILADAVAPPASSTCWFQDAARCRTFRIVVSTTNSRLHVAAPTNDDAILWLGSSTTSLSVGDATVAAGASGADRTVKVPVTLSRAAARAVTVHFKLVAGSALAPASYVAKRGTVRVERGSVATSIPVHVHGGVGFQPSETFYVQLTSATNVGIGRATGDVTVLTSARGVPDPIDPSLRGATLTQIVAATGATADTYSVTPSAGAVTVSGNASVTSPNDRMLFWPTSETPTSDQQVCATWSAQQPAQGIGVLVQEGLALRFATRDGVTKGITITKNVWGYANYYLIVHVWNSSVSIPFKTVESVDLNSYLVHGHVLDPLPWNLCARVVGSTLQFEVWTAGDPTPAWGDTTQGATVPLPPGYDFAGVAGWYVGHLAHGDSTTYSNLSVGPPKSAPAV
jgi:Calx-beta domain